MHPYLAKWKEIEKLLYEVRNDLPAGGRIQDPTPAPVGLLTGSLEEFQEFLDHNELELAWDALAAVAARTNAPADCWRKLARAAGLMELPEKEEEAEQHALQRSRLSKSEDEMEAP